MTALEMQNTVNTQQGKDAAKELFLEFPWFYDNVYLIVQDIIEEFFQKEYSLKFMGVSYDNENVLFFGDEYFSGKIPVNKSASAVIRVSSGLVSSLLDDVLGASDEKFSLKKLTDIEAALMHSFTLFVYNKLEELFIKKEPDKKTIKKSKIYNFTFYVRHNEKHAGKLIISIPDYAVKDNIEEEYREDCFDISGLDNAEVIVTLRAGTSRVPLNDLKSLENGDIVIMDNSDIYTMQLLLNDNTAEISVTPNPAAIISVDKNGDDEMSSEPNNTGSMWDTIMVDVSAEFDNFKMTLGELKQISEGLVIDIGSVYDGKIKLRAAKQVIAEGGLVILNDRYGIRIDSIKEPEETAPEPDEPEYAEEEHNDDAEEELQEEEPAAVKKKPAAKPAKSKTAAKKTEEEEQDDKNFDYSDFEIEDESI